MEGCVSMSIIHILDHQNSEIVGWITQVSYDSHKSSLENEEKYEFTAPVAEEDLDKIQGRSRLLIPAEEGDYREFIVTEKIDLTRSGEVEVYSEASYTDLRKLKTIHPQVRDGQTVEAAVEFVLEGINGWELGVTEYSGIRKWVIEKDLDAYDALKAIASLFDCEIRFRVVISGNKVIGRYVDFVKRIGQDTGKEIVEGKDLLGIKRRLLAKRVVTALICIGPEREDGTRLKVTVKDEAAFQNWNWQGQHLVEVYEPQSTDTEMTEERLTQLGETELKKRITAAVEYEAEGAALDHIFGYDHEVVRLGDSAKIKDEKFNPPMYLDSRVIFVERSIFDKSKKKYKLGEVIEYKKEDVFRVWKDLQALYATKVIKSPEPPEGKANIIWIQTGGKVDVAHTWNAATGQWEKITPTEASEVGSYTQEEINNKDQSTFEDGTYYSDQVAKNAEENANQYTKEKVQEAKDYAEPKIPDTVPPVPTGLTATGGFKTVFVEWDLISELYIAKYQVYGSETNNFTPGPSNLLFEGKASSYAHDAGTNKTYYYKVRAVNTKGVAGPSSETITASTVKIMTDDMLFGSVNKDIIANLAVDAGKLADLSVNAQKLVDGAVIAQKIADSSVEAGKIAAGAVTNPKLSSLAVDASKLANGAVLEGKLGELAVTAGKLASGSVTLGKVANGAVNNPALASLAVDAAKLADGSATESKIASSAITNAKLAALAVANGNLQNGAVNNTKLANLSVDASKLADSAVTATKIANLAVGTAAIQDAAITSAKVSRLSADKITVGAGAIFEGGYDPTKIEVGGRNLFSNSETPFSWSGVGSVALNSEDFLNGFKATGGNDSYANFVQLNDVIKGNGFYTISFEVRGTQSTSVGLFVNIAGIKSPNRFMTNYSNTYNGRQSYTVEVTDYSETNNWIRFHFQYAYFRIKDIKVEKGNKATDWTPAPEDNPSLLWVYQNTSYFDGGQIYTNTVTANQIATGTITAASGIIADAAITNAKIASLAVGNAALANASVDAAKIKDLSVGTAELANASITSAKIQNLAVGTAAIADAAITNAKIANLAVGTAAIQDAAITNAKISELSAGKIKTGYLLVGGSQLSPGTDFNASGIPRISGNVAGAVSTNTNGTYLYLTSTSTGEGYAYLDRFPLEGAGRKVTIAYDYANDITSKGSDIFLLASRTKYSEANKTTNQYDYAYHISETSFDGKYTNAGWSRVYKTITLANDVQSAFLRLDHNGSKTEGTSANVRFRNIMVNYGELAIEWQPHTDENISIGAIAADKMAANSITAANAALADASISTAKIQNLAVGNAALANASVTNAKIGNLAVGTGQIADAAITNAKIANLAVDGAKIKDASITNAKIANLSVDNAKISDLHGSKIIANTITATHLNVTDLSAISATFSGSLTSVDRNNSIVIDGKSVNANGRTIFDVDSTVPVIYYGNLTQPKLAAYGKMYVHELTFSVSSGSYSPGDFIETDLYIKDYQTVAIEGIIKVECQAVAKEWYAYENDNGRVFYGDIYRTKIRISPHYAYTSGGTTIKVYVTILGYR
jgi:phage minor structural protein